jgi:LmbE family N-acetylglucosaminyl deacetylase
MRSLVVAAHPDDEVLGCGGTIARLASQGEDVHILIVAEGATSRAGHRSEANPVLVSDLADAARDAGALLGAKQVRLLGFPDNQLDTVPLLEIVKRIETVIEDVAPSTVYCHHGGDLNIDHQVVFRAVLTATRPVPASTVRAVYAFEVASSTEWAFQRLSPVFRADTFFDVSAVLDTKLRALERYEGEVRRFPHPRSREAVEAIARRWGSVAGVRAAEAFETVRVVR